MPNHIYSRLKVYCHEDNAQQKLKAFKDFVWDSYGEMIDFNKITPQPDGIQDENPMILCESERDFNIKNWGTKWNAYNCKITCEESWKICFEFQTAWSIPRPIIAKLFELFKAELDIVYLGVCEGGWFAEMMWNEGSEVKTCDVNGISFAKEMLLFAIKND